MELSLSRREVLRYELLLVGKPDSSGAGQVRIESPGRRPSTPSESNHHPGTLDHRAPEQRAAGERITAEPGLGLAWLASSRPAHARAKRKELKRLARHGSSGQPAGEGLAPSPVALRHRQPGCWNQRTFRPKKSAPSGNKGMQLKRHIDATLGSGNLREAVRLPIGEDLNEWLAVNTVDFFNQVNILYGTLMEFCTPATCPTMSAGPKYEYRWADGVKIKRPIEVSAPKYVEYLMDWIEAQLDDENIFPQKLGAPFPSNFRDVVKTIFKRLFRVYAHIYHSHFQVIMKLQEEAHLNTCFKQFTLFTLEFRLIDRAELAPLSELIDPIILGC
ncbi:MOB kinase activator-like 1A [Panicum miliaceum]|uniref:MOB kinase activator-like 1A n=1 Tax=Panicum miliaceum TaxID=4540 RepID=A0A3L6TGM1_PANMI|nr:MOB kinase activator-like 1A [Panicum miliaceum]